MRQLDDLLSRVTTTRQMETVYPAEGEDFEPYDHLVIGAEVEVDGVAYSQTATLHPNAYPEVVERVEALTAQHLARQVMEATR